MFLALLLHDKTLFCSFGFVTFGSDGDVNQIGLFYNYSPLFCRLMGANLADWDCGLGCLYH